MNYEDDELERMRARREQRRNVSRSSSDKKTRTGSGGRSSQTGSDEIFKSSYSGPKGKKNGRSDVKGSAHARRTAARRKKRLIIAAEIIVIFMLVIGGGLWYLYERTFGSLQKIEFNEDAVMNVNLSEEQLEGMKGYFTVACFGVDSRSVNGKMNVGKGTNADVNLIANINLETGEIRLVSVFRDTYLNISDKNSYNKINAAYAQGGPEQAVKALNKNLGLNITQYATFNWKAVADAINLLGGVDITISESEFSWINAYITETVEETGIGSTQLKHAGDVHLDGVQAVAYGRLRLGDTDYARTERQRIILSKAFEKAKEADWATLNCIIQTVMPQLATNITISDMIPLARNISNYHMGDTAGFPSARGEMDIGKIGDCVIPQTLEYNVKELHKFLFDEEDYQVPSNVQEYSDHIAQTTGLTTEGKLIGHVPVDQGISANSYIKRQQQKVSEKAAAEAAEKAAAEAAETETEESTEESSVTDETGESGTDGETLFDPDEEWLDEWDEDWYVDWPGRESEAYGPGSEAGSGPSGSSGGNRNDRPGTGTTEADNASGPGADSDNSDSGNKVPSKPGTGTTQAETEGNGPSETIGANGGGTGNSSSGVKSPLDPGNNTSGNVSGPGSSQGPGA